MKNNEDKCYCKECKNGQRTIKKPYDIAKMYYKGTYKKIPQNELWRMLKHNEIYGDTIKISKNKLAAVKELQDITIENKLINNIEFEKGEKDKEVWRKQANYLDFLIRKFDKVLDGKADIEIKERENNEK